MTIDLSPDPSDNQFYECAAAADAAYIVTGNTRDCPKPYKNTNIITARQLFRLLEASRT